MQVLPFWGVATRAPMGLRFRAARRFRAVRFTRRGPSTGGSPLVDSAVSGFTAPLLGFPRTTFRRTREPSRPLRPGCATRECVRTRPS
jgi:hypothetical protein